MYLGSSIVCTVFPVNIAIYFKEYIRGSSILRVDEEPNCIDRTCHDLVESSCRPRLQQRPRSRPCALREPFVTPGNTWVSIRASSPIFRRPHQQPCSWVDSVKTAIDVSHTAGNAVNLGTSAASVPILPRLKMLRKGRAQRHTGETGADRRCGSGIGHSCIQLPDPASFISA